LIGESASSAVRPVLLPSTRRGPLPSPELTQQDRSGDTDEIALTPWDINTLALDPDAALDFLISLPSGPPHRVAFSSSLRFWVEAAKLSLELITRQCFVPTIKEDKRDNIRSFRAVWEAVINEEDSRRVQLLADSMPPICRAFLLPEGKRSPLPSDLVSSFVNQTVDAFVRKSLASTSLLPVRRSRGTVSLAEQWVRALSSEDPHPEATTEELVSFSKELRSWLSQIQPIPSDTPFRTCFRLDSPCDDAEEWRVSFHLQANDDRSLLVPAEKVWCYHFSEAAV
jgi:hypothetical protein